jgi:beta-lactamase regulating signal transducer with metallopeptidase domain
MTVTVLNHLWQSSLFALAVWILAFLFRNNGASVRHGLWLAASAKFLLPFSLLAAIGRMSFAHSVAPGSMQALVRIAPAAMPFNTVPALAVSAPQQLPWAAIAAAIWGVGFLAIVLFWLARAMRLERIVRAAAPLDIDAPIPVRATAELLEPGLAGIFRPVILVPESLMQKLSRTEVDTILAHELCHLRRRDNLAALVHMLVEAVFWFHPLVWFIGARLVEEREQACDEGVLDYGKQPLD